MNKQNVKSLVIGFSLGVTTILALGQNSAQSRQVGRYQVAGAGGGSAQTFVIIDTTTGVAKLLGGPSINLTLGVGFDELKSQQH